MLNIIDLTKRSTNMANLLSGKVRNPEDLEAEIIEDRNYNSADLAAVEIEVNKVRKKK